MSEYCKGCLKRDTDHPACLICVDGDRKLERVGLLEDEFCVVVLTRAKEIFGEDAATKIDLDKMVKLCCFVAEDVGFPLTRGWYKDVKEVCER